MSTRSDIIVKRADGKWARIYVHFDGYPSHHGPILLGHYADQAKADALVALGDLSSLDISTDAPEGHSYDNRTPGHSVAYGRDRGETGTEATVGDTLADVWPDEDTWTEYTYVYDGGVWSYGEPDGGSDNLRPLADWQAHGGED